MSIKEENVVRCVYHLLCLSHVACYPVYFQDSSDSVFDLLNVSLKFQTHTIILSGLCICIIINDTFAHPRAVMVAQ